MNGQYIELKATVIDLDGAPAAGTTVTLHCMDQWSYQRPGGWNAFPATELKTDVGGECVFKIPKRLEWGDPGPDGFRSVEPGHEPLERLFLVVNPSGKHAGAISKVMTTDDAPTSPARTQTDPWGPRTQTDPWGPPVILSEPATTVDLQLKRPIRISGSIEASPGKLEEIRVEAVHDLYLASRTGVGGEVFRSETSVDEAGRFALPKLYPHNTRLDFYGDGWKASALVPEPAELPSQHQLSLGRGEQKINASFTLSWEDLH